MARVYSTGIISREAYQSCDLTEVSEEHCSCCSQTRAAGLAAGVWIGPESHHYFFQIQIHSETSESSNPGWYINRENRQARGLRVCAWFSVTHILMPKSRTR